MTTINGRFELGKDCQTTSATTWVVARAFVDPHFVMVLTVPVVYLHAAPRTDGPS